MSNSVCRVCLARDHRMLCIKNTGLQDIYETITNAKLNTEDARSVAICNICCSQLQRCQRFCEMGRRAKQILTGLINNGSEISQATVQMFNLGIKHDLSVTTTQLMSFNNLNNENASVAVKEEFNQVEENSCEDNIEDNVMIPPDTVHMLDHSGIKHYISVNITQPMSLNSKSSPIAVKEEFIQIKESSVDDIEDEMVIKIESYQVNENITKHINCCKILQTKKCLQKHKMIHTGEKPYACSQCYKTFSRNGLLQRHMRIHTGEKPYACNQCDRTFSQNAHLQQHMRIHTGEKPYTCSQCDKTFSHNVSLKHHMIIHTGEKPYACSQCDKTFSWNAHLQQHMRIHNGEKPYTCSQCDKKFSQNSNLMQHMRIHTGEKPYACSQCDRTFSQNSNLMQHMRIHTGEKPYACSECDKTFSRNNLLQQHKNIHTGEKPYDCS